MQLLSEISIVYGDGQADVEIDVKRVLHAYLVD